MQQMLGFSHKNTYINQHIKDFFISNQRSYFHKKFALQPLIKAVIKDYVLPVTKTNHFWRGAKSF